MTNRKESDYWERDSIAAGLLRASLQCAVPLWADQLSSRPWPDLMQRKDRCLEMIAHHGDNILYRFKKPGDTAQAFNALAEAVAILSFLPGGIKVFGLEFKFVHPEGGHNV